MPTRFISSEYDRTQLVKVLSTIEGPFTISWEKGRRRSDEQNRLQRDICNKVAEQLGDRTAEDVRAHGKLHFGVPILRAENEAFAEKYDRLIKHLPYADKIELMAVPMDLPITRIMTVKQKTAFLEAMMKYWAEQGIVINAGERDREGVAAE